jgi:hypothetical protein
MAFPVHNNGLNPACFSRKQAPVASRNEERYDSVRAERPTSLTPEVTGALRVEALTLKALVAIPSLRS